MVDPGIEKWGRWRHGDKRFCVWTQLVDVNPRRCHCLRDDALPDFRRNVTPLFSVSREKVWKSARQKYFVYKLQLQKYFAFRSTPNHHRWNVEHGKWPRLLNVMFSFMDGGGGSQIWGLKPTWKKALNVLLQGNWNQCNCLANMIRCTRCKKRRGGKIGCEKKCHYLKLNEWFPSCHAIAVRFDITGYTNWKMK